MASNRSAGMSSMPELTDLAKILRMNGDKVLNGSSKFSLSTKLLHNLNHDFSLIVDDSKELESSFRVCNSSEIELFRDLKFIHDFVQKTIYLKVVHIPKDGPIAVDITKFRSLKYLELQKVCIDLVKGIQSLRSQLESICCTGGGGVGTVGRLLAACGGDASVGFVWASLQTLALPYNGLGRLDKSLELAPWLQTLDLSHNHISIATELDCLSNLKHVNLGYNKLDSVPPFNRATTRTLRSLVLKNNYIENLDGLQGLELMELDLSYNCLIDHSCLWPLATMTSLIWLNLEENPMFYHDKHRHLTITYLHSSLAESQFILDHRPLTKSEKAFVADNRAYTLRSYPPLQKDASASDTEAFVVVENTAGLRNDLTASQSSQSASGSLDKSTMKSRRRTNVREVDIAEDEDEDTSKDQRAVDSRVSQSLLETSMEHLETKKKILALREKYGGDKWLSSDSGSHIQDIMGIQKTLGLFLSSTPTAISTPTVDSIKSNPSSDLSNIQTDDSTDVNYSSYPEISVADESKIESEEPTLQQTEIEITQIETLESFYDPEEDPGDVFLVNKKRDDDSDAEILLVVSKDDIKEVDSISHKIKFKWSIDLVVSCIMGRGSSPTIDFIFDTTRRDRQNRTYLVEPEDAVKIVKIVGEMIEERPIELKVFKCMKCSTHFSQDQDPILSVTKNGNSKTPTCPSCKSKLVILTDELITPDVDSHENNTRNVVEEINIDDNREKTESLKELVGNLQNEGNLTHSTSQSSIGGTEGGAMSITTSMVYSDSRPQAQVCCSATSLEDSRESTPSAGTVMKKYESDIEVLSNPSQSSIEVLDDSGKSNLTPSRKRSSEERRIAIAPTLLTIPDTTPVMAGLTESSSSGSLTDSICTAYENKKSKSTAIPDNKTQQKGGNQELDQSEIIGSLKESYAPVSNLSSMLGDLLSSMKIGSTKGSPSKSSEEPEYLGSDVQYSYTNFSSIDHRIKLHLILNVFELENEELVLLLRTDILLQNQVSTFPGCLILSTSKVYILKITGAEGEDPSRWLQKKMSWTMDRLRTFAPLPFKQGVLVELEQPSRNSEDSPHFMILCILQDFQRTSNFLFYLTDLSLPTSCEVEFGIPEQCTNAIHSLMASSKNYRDNDAVRIFALFSSAILNLENHEVKLKIGGLLVTTSSLVLTEDKINWLIPDSNEVPAKLTEQAMSNLIEVASDGSSLDLNFLDEVAGIEEVWTLKFVSTEAASAVISAIQPPWEELFSVSLQITTKTKIDEDSSSNDKKL